MKRLSEHIGAVLLDRYVLVDLVGQGGSGVVYAAKDLTLGRRVAVKLLHEGLSSDAAFIKRFHAEAKAAASLNHPSIVRVFDSGEEHGAPFLVFEFLGGGTLREYLDSGVQLSIPQAARISLEIAQALAYAHNRGYVHRDIKPSNLLFDDEGRIRVADFGIARALAEAAWTEPVGVVIGTARYASPEQARGEQCFQEGDIYSFALVIIEAITGELPFLSDTTFATVMARTKESIVVPDSLGPLRNLVSEMGSLGVKDRPSAASVVERLAVIARELPIPDPLDLTSWTPSKNAFDPPTTVSRIPPVIVPSSAVGIDLEGALNPEHGVLDSKFVPPSPSNDFLRSVELANAKGEFFDQDEHLLIPEETTLALSGTSAKTSNAPVDQNAHSDSESGPGELHWFEALQADADSTLTVGQVGAVAGQTLIESNQETRGPREDSQSDGVKVSKRLKKSKGEGSDATESSQKRRSVFKRSAVLLGILALVVAGLIVAISALSSPAKFSIPNVIGKAASVAQGSITKAGGVASTSASVYDPSIPKGDVVSQFPSPGSLVVKGVKVNLTISLGPPLVAVPNVVGDPLQSSIDTLTSNHLSYTTSSSYSETVPTGDVISQSITGTKVVQGSKVALVISKGPVPRIVPNLVGQSLAAAKSTLGSQGLNLTSQVAYSNSVPSGSIISQNIPAGNSVARGSTLSVVVSQGPHLVSVPDLTGMTLSQAQAALAGVGLSVGSVYAPKGSIVIILQNPLASTSVLYGSTVDIYGIKK